MRCRRHLPRGCQMTKEGFDLLPAHLARMPQPVKAHES